MTNDYVHHLVVVALIAFCVWATGSILPMLALVLLLE